MVNIEIDGNCYEVIKNYKDAFSLEEFQNKYTISPREYVLFKLILKGYYEDNVKQAKKINKISGLSNYIKDYCSYECRYFLLKKKK